MWPPNYTVGREFGVFNPLVFWSIGPVVTVFLHPSAFPKMAPTTIGPQEVAGERRHSTMLLRKDKSEIPFNDLTCTLEHIAKEADGISARTVVMATDCGR